MEWLVGVYDLYAFAAITRRSMFWFVAATIPVGFAAALMQLAAYFAS